MERNVVYLGYRDNIRLANDRVELILSAEFGPRILRYAPLGGENILGEIPPSVQGKATPFGDAWHIYGGHRLWHAPEHPVRTYWPDNRPLEVAERGATVVLTQEVEQNTQLQKSIEVTLAPSGSEVTIVHRIANRGPFDVRLALWALTVMTTGGVAVFPNAPFVPFPEDLLPARPLVLWSYTKLADPRWTWGKRLFQLRQDPAMAEPQKVGFFNKEGWAAYHRDRLLFVKRYGHAPGEHADYGCNTETFVNDTMIEIETLGPLVAIAPGAAAEHTERWFLFEDVENDVDEDRYYARLASVLARTHG